MKGTVQGILLCSFLVACQTLYWDGPLNDYSELEGCRGGTVNMSWGYSLRPGERVEDIKWHFTDQYGLQHLIAMETEGHFAATDDHFSYRLEQVDSAGLELKYVRGSDSGRYTVTITTLDGAGDYFISTLTAFLNVSESPRVRGGELQIHQLPNAVYSNDTGQWHVQLKCGYFYSLGQPNVSVVWTTPSGLRQWSDSSEDGQFTLLLSNPVQDGNYTCQVSRDNDSAASCLPSDSPMMQGSSVMVDGVSTSFTLLQAQLQQDTGRLREENNHLTHALNNLQRSVDTRMASLQAQVHELKANESRVDQLERMKANQSRVDQLERMMASLCQQLPCLLNLGDHCTRDLTTRPTTTPATPTHWPTETTRRPTRRPTTTTRRPTTTWHREWWLTGTTQFPTTTLTPTTTRTTTTTRPATQCLEVFCETCRGLGPD